MADHTAMPLWTDAQSVRTALIKEGWRSPDTYDNFFAPLAEGSAVYLFQLYQRDDYSKAIVAYVGMSTRLSNRIENHNVLPGLRTLEHWPMRWFKPAKPQELRAIERAYIVRFDPPWNIIGRSRGVVLS